MLTRALNITYTTNCAFDRDKAQRQGSVSQGW